MASTKVETRDNRELRRVEALNEEGEVAGFAQYQIGLDESTFEFTHTEVDERFEGQGVGSTLAAGVMEFARAEGIKIIPTCSFIRSYMDEHDDTHDLLAPEKTDDEAQGGEERDEETAQS